MCGSFFSASFRNVRGGRSSSRRACRVFGKLEKKDRRVGEKLEPRVPQPRRFWSSQHRPSPSSFFLDACRGEALVLLSTA